MNTYRTVSDLQAAREADRRRMAWFLQVAQRKIIQSQRRTAVSANSAIDIPESAHR